MYRGRFAPSPTGVLHAGSLVAALASWLDARAHCGVWLLRIEDVDTPRCVPGAAEAIVRQLALLSLSPDETVLYQTDRTALYRAALDQLIATGQAYPCACSRKDIALALSAQGSAKPRHGELVYPGTCRPQRGGLQSKDGRAWRLMLPENNMNKPEALSYNKHYAIKSIANGVCVVEWSDRRLGNQRQNVTADVGDFVLQRADGPWAYQMAVVVDDAAQGITHIVRGEDLADNTARQILLQRALGYTVPHYLHVPLVLGTDGEKLSKQNGAQALDVSDPLLCLQQAGAALGLAATTPLQPSVSDFLAQAVIQWQARWP